MVPNCNPDDATYGSYTPAANNLYGYAMSSFLVTSDFKFLIEDEIASFDLSNTSSTDGTGYVLEVNLDYPRELHDLLSDYPLSAEKLKITRDMLSLYSESLADKRFMAQENCHLTYTTSQST